MTLTSPAGTTVTISTDNGGTNDDVFNGTVWDDSAADLVADYVYTNLVAVPTLAPEGRLAAFRGQDPNGTWTLTVTDDTDLALGDVSTWSLDVATLTTAPASTPTTYSQSPNLAIPSNVVFTGTDTIAASGLETYVIDIEVYVEVTHTWSADVNLSLTSPSGTIVQLTTLNGAGNDNVYNGTLFTAAVTDSVTDHVYANLVTATPLSPEGGLDTLIGQDPNGNWTLTVFDPVAADGGTFVRWDLTIKTCVGAGNAFCTNGSLGIDHTTMCPCTPGAPGNGCGHSFDPNGANISATGSSAADTVVLHSQFEPVSSFTLFMQHANPGDTVFHDGVLCAANPLIRLRGRAAVAGEAFFPNSNFANDSTTTLSTRGMTFPGSGATMRYAAWYRNASSTFCPPATANVTNGWVITW
jgi:subtilisin-like proprotein convertase family protein